MVTRRKSVIGFRAVSNEEQGIQASLLSRPPERSFWSQEKDQQVYQQALEIVLSVRPGSSDTVGIENRRLSDLNRIQERGDQFQLLIRGLEKPYSQEVLISSSGFLILSQELVLYPRTTLRPGSPMSSRLLRNLPSRAMGVCP